jgi:large subunit ribosomal protein L13
MAKVTQSTKPVSEKEIKREWKLVDLKGQVLGRAVNSIATYLQGKNKSNYVPYLDMGDNVVVINAQKVELTGRKAESKEYTLFSGYPGGLRKVSFENLIKNDPEKVVRHAVSGMLPKNKLRDQRLARLHVFAGAEHTFTDKFTK